MRKRKHSNKLEGGVWPRYLESVSEPKLVLNSLVLTCLFLSTPRITGMYHHVMTLGWKVTKGLSAKMVRKPDKPKRTFHAREGIGLVCLGMGKDAPCG